MDQSFEDDIFNMVFLLYVSLLLVNLMGKSEQINHNRVFGLHRLLLIVHRPIKNTMIIFFNQFTALIYELINFRVLSRVSCILVTSRNST